MRRALTFFLMPALSAGLASASPARDEAMALVRQGVALIRQAGPERAYAEISAGALQQRADLHLVVYGLGGDCLAHGGNPAQVGRNLIEQTDIEGRLFVKERLLMAQVRPEGFWHEHKQANLFSKRVETRLMYCEGVAGTTVCSSVRR